MKTESVFKSVIDHMLSILSSQEEIPVPRLGKIFLLALELKESVIKVTEEFSNDNKTYKERLAHTNWEVKTLVEIMVKANYLVHLRNKIEMPSLEEQTKEALEDKELVKFFKKVDKLLSKN